MDNFDEEILKITKSNQNFIYPMCVVSDRYGGTYSDGSWTAWCTGVGFLPDGPFSGDGECMTFWENNKKENEKGEGYIVGIGNTPDEAVLDLHKKYFNRTDV